MKKTLITAFLLLIHMHVYAVLKLELTQGVKSEIPIAIVPFSGADSVPAESNISDVIINDFQHTGEFDVYTDNRLPSHPQNAQEVNLDHWRKTGVGYLVVGNVKPSSNGQYQVMVSLIDVFANGASRQVKSNAILFSKIYTVPKNHLRALGHHISDILYEDMLNVRGIFSTKLAYIVVKHKNRGDGNYQLIVSDYDGFNPQVVLNSNQPIMSPAWSPDGRQLAFVSFKQTFPAIYTVDLSSGAIKQLTKLAGINGAPAWSPSGNAISYVSSLTGQAKIYRMDMASKKIEQLTTGSAIDTEPSYSPDGRKLLFTSNRGGGPQIYQLDLNSKRIERLTYTGRYNARASYSPDGQKIVMIHRGNSKFYVGVQDSSTDTFRVLTKSGGDESPSFSPNGKLVIYATLNRGKPVLAIVSTNGEVQMALPETSGGDVQEPVWSPFLSKE